MKYPLNLKEPFVRGVDADRSSCLGSAEGHQVKEYIPWCVKDKSGEDESDESEYDEMNLMREPLLLHIPRKLVNVYK